jgi:excisionase family DNA binding protein
MGLTMMTSLSDIELLTIEEFAKRYRVGRSTVFMWITSKKMIQGIHYFKIGKTVRIPWSMELLASLSTIEFGKDEPPASRSGKNKNMINLDY